MMIRKYLHIIIFILLATPAFAQKIAVKNNLLLDGAMAPNLGLEFVTGERSSIAVDMGGTKKPWWSTDGKALYVQPEYRYWFNGRPMTRQYVGIAMIGSHYDFQFGSEHHHGNAIGAGLSLGYDIMLSKHLVLDCFGSFGAIFYKQKQYFSTNKGTDNPDDWFADGGAHNNANGYLLSPIKLGISISYILK